MNRLDKKITKDHLFLRRGSKRILVHQPFRASSDENPDCESRSWQRVGEARTVANAASDKGQEKKDVNEQAQKEWRTVRFSTLMDLRHFQKNSELEQQFQNLQRASRTPK